MDKKVLFAVILIAFIGGIVLSNLLSFKDDSLGKTLSQDDITKNLKPLSCDLGQKPCVVKFDGKDVEISLNPLPLETMQPLYLLVKGLGEINEPNVRLTGVNMDMGTIRADLKSVGIKHSAKVTLSACVINVMRYKLALFSGDKDLGIWVYFDLYQ